MNSPVWSLVPVMMRESQMFLVSRMVCGVPLPIVISAGSSIGLRRQKV